MLAATLPPPALGERCCVSCGAVCDDLDQHECGCVSDAADALADWRAVQLSESGHAIACEVDAVRCIGWSRDCEDAGDHASAGYWLGLAWLAREGAAVASLGARVAQAEITAIRMRCSPTERARLLRRAVAR